MHLDSILAQIFPHNCLGCSEVGTICCQKCLAKLKDFEDPKQCYNCNLKTTSCAHVCSDCKSKASLKGLYFVTNYDLELAQKLVHRLKFKHALEAARPIAKLMAMELKSSFPDLQSLILSPVPTSNSRIRQRGWDQAAIIAKLIARELGIPKKSLLLRLNNRSDQIGLGRFGRVKSSEHVFLARVGTKLKSTDQIILVDDIITTGATLNAAARTLKQNFKNDIFGLTFARTSRLDSITK